GSVNRRRVPKRPRCQSRQTLTVMRKSHDRAAELSRRVGHACQPRVIASWAASSASAGPTSAAATRRIAVAYKGMIATKSASSAENLDASASCAQSITVPKRCPDDAILVRLHSMLLSLPPLRDPPIVREGLTRSKCFLIPLTNTTEHPNS